MRLFSGVTWEGVAAGFVRDHDYKKKNSDQNVFYMILLLLSVGLFTMCMASKTQCGRGIILIYVTGRETYRTIWAKSASFHIVLVCVQSPTLLERNRRGTF